MININELSSLPGCRAITKREKQWEHCQNRYTKVTTRKFVICIKMRKCLLTF